MDGHGATEIGAQLKGDVDLAYARLNRRREELEAAVGDTSSSEEYRKGLVRYAEAGVAAAMEELEHALRSFEAFLKTSGLLEEGRTRLNQDKKASSFGEE